MKKVIDEAVYSKAWEGFKGNDWKEATSVVDSSKIIIHLMTVIKSS